MRRAASLILLIAVLLSQWAQCFRRENGCTACGRPPAPHVHLREMLAVGQPQGRCCCGLSLKGEKQESARAAGASCGESSPEWLEQPGPRKGCCEDVLSLPYEIGVSLRSASIEGEDEAGHAQVLYLTPGLCHLFNGTRYSGRSIASPAAPPPVRFHLLTQILLI